MTNTDLPKIRNYRSKIASNSFTSKVNTRDFSALWSTNHRRYLPGPYLEYLVWFTWSERGKPLTLSDMPSGKVSACSLDVSGGQILSWSCTL